MAKQKSGRVAGIVALVIGGVIGLGFYALKQSMRGGTQPTPTIEQDWNGLTDVTGRYVGPDAEALRLIEAGIAPNRPIVRSDGLTLLHLTSSKSVAEKAIALGANVDQRAVVHGGTPLFSTSSADVAEVLLDHGADLNFVASSGHRAIHINSSVPVVAVLLDRGTDPNSTDGDDVPVLASVFHRERLAGRPLLSPGITVTEWREKMVKELLDHGADANALDADGLSVLDHALRASKPKPNFSAVSQSALHLESPEQRWPAHYTMVRGLFESLGDTAPQVSPETVDVFLAVHRRVEPPLQIIKKKLVGEPLTDEEERQYAAYLKERGPLPGSNKTYAPIFEVGLTEDAQWVIDKVEALSESQP